MYKIVILSLIYGVVRFLGNNLSSCICFYVVNLHSKCFANEQFLVLFALSMLKSLVGYSL